METPEGCKLWEQGPEIYIWATQRSLSSAVITFLITLLLNGTLAGFAVLAIAGLLNHQGKPVPPGMPIPQSDDGDPMTFGELMVFVAILTSFVLIGLCTIGVFILNVWGKVEVMLDGPVGIVRTGVGILSRTRRFDASTVKNVYTTQSAWKNGKQVKKAICIEANRTIKFGAQLDELHQEWMCTVLYKLMMPSTESV